MSPISLRKILHKQELSSLLEDLVGMLNIAVDVEEVDGRKLLSIGQQTANNRYPVKISTEVIGWVVGSEQATILANLLSLLAKQEAEKKELAKELLERYQEIDLFEDILTQLTTSLDKREIAQLVLQEISQLICSSAGMILLLNADATAFEVIAEFGAFFGRDRPKPGKGIIGNIVESNRAELVNDVQADPRSDGNKIIKALVCAPLRAKQRVVGAIAIGAHQTDVYTAEHLKLVTIFASQTAIAIEKALLYEQSCQATAQFKAQTQRLQQALDDLQLAQAQLIQSEKMSSLGQLIAGVAHEINNPVNFIYGNLKYVADYTQDLLNLLRSYQEFLPIAPEELQLQLESVDWEFLQQDLPKLLESMKLGTDRIVEIVRSLKNFSRHDEAEMKTVNIHDGINGTLMILRHRLKASPHHPDIEVVKEYAELPSVECYPGQLNQVFMNILANAIDAIEEEMANGKSNRIPQIWICTELFHEQWIVIHIADNGLGMSEDVIRRIYDPFFTTKEVGKGTGLGMAISHQIVVEKHRGILKCRSRPGEGTEFWIQIPLNCSTSNAALRQSPAIARQNLPTKSTPTADASGFISSATPKLRSNNLLSQHVQLIQRLNLQNPNIGNSSPDQFYQMLQRNPISLKLYATLLSRFYSPNSVQLPQQRNINSLQEGERETGNSKGEWGMGH
ncbi:GAF domain-containing sensor histidine kinase [Nostoc sp. CENA67]|uniref:histidine kinase n=1 Tax=Amazonocrinis nigriterrae CENA67 TaxID=2794033 RepID=A0A8J7HTT6_9NOST|nr:ATP-binding protein [Amazonocrinis nigriterrae]MBH8563387.1 GAF domain-containing sensor histidine kinase [Amazonocrinis nigriterrae CENA67]